MNKRVVAYCRVSTKSDDQENSYENQKSYFEREIRNNTDYEYCGIYADRGITGTTLEKRPDFNRMLTNAGLDINNGFKIIAEPKFDLIVTKNTSRFARNVSVDGILKALANNNVYVHFLDLDKTNENVDDITYIQIFATFDERDSRDKSKKTKFGMIEGAKNKNRILCNNKIHGYDYIQEENRLVANEQAPHIKRMFEMYVEGIGAHRIAKIFFNEGIINKIGKPYREDTIRGILTNEKYYGMVTRMKYDTGVVFNKHYPHIRPEEEQIRFMSDKVDTIISKELFEKAQEIRTNRTQHTKQVGVKKGVNYGTSPYAYKIFCNSCGTQYRSTATKYYGKRKERYYCCVGKQNLNPTQKCTNPNVSETFLNNELSEKYCEMFADSFVIAQRLLVELKSIINNAIYNKNSNEELAQLEAEHEKYEAQLKRATLALIEGNEKSFDEIIKPISAKNKEVVAKINTLSKSTAEKINDLLLIEESLKELKRRLSENFELEKIYEVSFNETNDLKETFVEYSDFNGVYHADYSTPPKIQFTRDEILKNIDSIWVNRSKVLTIKFKTFTEVEQLVKRHEHLMTDRILGIFEELRENGWNRFLCYKYSDFWK